MADDSGMSLSQPHLNISVTAPLCRGLPASTSTKIKIKVDTDDDSRRHVFTRSADLTKPTSIGGRIVKRRRTKSAVNLDTIAHRRTPRRCTNDVGNVKREDLHDHLNSNSANNIRPIVGMAKQSSEPSRLLSLPPELRNMIWMFAVVSAKPLTILRDTPRQPGITLACKMTRGEALGLFYSQNTFACTVTNYDATEYKRYRRVADRYGLRIVLLTHRRSIGDRAILHDNLLIWLESTWTGESAPLGYIPGHTDESFAWEKLSHRIVKLFNQAKLLRGKVAWHNAREILSNAVDAAGVCGETWNSA